MNLTYNTTTIFPTIIHQFDIGGFEHIKAQLIDNSNNLKTDDTNIHITNTLYYD